MTYAIRSTIQHPAAYRAAIARNRAANADVTRARHAAERRPGWEADNPDLIGWLNASRDRSPFARSLLASLDKWGTLTDGQAAAVRKIIREDAARAANPLPKVPDALVHDDALLAAFNRARAAGIKRPALTLRADVGGEPVALRFSLAPDHGKNPGAIYVKRHGDGLYLGKVVGGQLFKSREAGDAELDAARKLMTDPAGEARANGLKWGVCCVCNRTLTDAESVKAGIGPVCANKWGFAPV